MVGVPRSKGCVRCRKQKKGCDLKRPSCANCSRISATCIYEAKKVQFIPSSTPAVPNTSASTSTSPSSSTNSSTAVVPVNRTQTALQPWCLDKTALELEAEDAFWTAYLPNGGRDNSIGIGIQPVSWAPLIRRFAHQDGLTRLAFQALSLTALGRVRDDMRLLKQGSELYTRALRRMNVTLKQPERARSDHVLATAQLLSTYEIFRGDMLNGEKLGVSTQGADWQKHVDGALQLVDYRMQNGEMTDASWELLRHARESAIMSGGVLSRPNNRMACKSETNLERPTIDIQDDLFDILYRTPKLLNDIDGCLKQLAAAKEGPNRQAAIQRTIDVLKSAADIARELHDWELKTLDKCLKKDQKNGHVEEENLPKPSLFSICRDHGYGLFRTVMFYCWAVVPCYAKSWLTYRHLIEYAGYDYIENLTTLPLLPTWMDPHPYALHICNHIKHFFQPEAGLWGAQQAVLPMGTALFYFAAHDSLAMPEPQNMMMEYGNSKGAVVVSDFVRSIAALATPEGAKGNMADPAALRGMAREWFGYQYTAPPAG